MTIEAQSGFALPDEKDLRALSIPDFAYQAGNLSHWSVRKWLRDGRLKSVKIGSRRMIPVAELRRVIEGGL